MQHQLQYLQSHRPRNQHHQQTREFRIENLVGTNTADVYLYDEIGYFGVTAGDFIQAISGTKVDVLNLHLNTPGGDVFDGLAIMNALQQHPAQVTAYVDGLAASIGSVIAMGADKVVIAPNAQMMIHDAHGVAVGTADDMMEMANLLETNSQLIAGIYAAKTERSGKAAKTPDFFRKKMKATTWYTGAEAVKAGLADEVSTAPSKVDNSWDLSIFGSATEPPAPVQDEPQTEPFSWDPEVFRRAMKEAAG